MGRLFSRYSSISDDPADYPEAVESVDELPTDPVPENVAELEGKDSIHAERHGDDG